MSKFSKFARDLSEEFGISLEITESTPGQVGIRFGGLEEGSSFSLIVSQQFSSTAVELKPDPYGGEVISEISSLVLKKRSEVLDYLKQKMSSLSRVSLRIDQIDIHNDVLRESVEGKEIEFEAKVFQETSNLSKGIVSEQEILLISTAIGLFLIFLPTKRNVFKSADEVMGYPEGAVESILVNRYERNSKNREICISSHGYNCQGCNFNFKNVYGELGESFIIVHHIVPVSKLGADYVVDPIKDLIPLCANCHAIVHRTDPPLEISELRALMKQQNFL